MVAEPGTFGSDPGNPHLSSRVFGVDNPSGELYSEYWWLGGGRVHERRTEQCHGISGKETPENGGGHSQHTNAQ